MTMGEAPQGALAGIRVLDLSRILAGPFCTQILGDLGADIIKVEKPGSGDDTRGWGPPYLHDDDGNDTGESAYYLSANRNKRSVAVDIATPAGQALIDRLLAGCDVLIENFKVGALEKYGLSFAQVQARHPHIVYASITGFGQTGPRAGEAGYDLLAQAEAGLMTITGEPNGAPMKVGVAVSDVMTGLYAAVGILAALRARDTTGVGQHIDLALADVTLASLSNVAQHYLTAGRPAARQGNAHASIVPYQAFEAADGWLVVAVGNDAQFRRFAALLGRAGWADDADYATNAARVAHRARLVPLIADRLREKPTAVWIAACTEAGVPVGPVNDVPAIFAAAQTRARAMAVEMTHPARGAPITLVGNPLNLSDTPVSYRQAPPPCGSDTDAVLGALGFSIAEIAGLRETGIIG